MDRVLIVSALILAVGLGVALIRRGRRSAPRAVRPGELGLPTDRVGVVAFSSARCHACQRWHAALAEAGVPLVTVDVGDRPDLPRRYGVAATPLVLATAPDGRVIEAYTGEPPPEAVDRLARLAGGRSPAPV